jgi:hypothetical protein
MLLLTSVHPEIAVSFLPPSLEGGLRGLQINNLNPLYPPLKKGEVKG